MSSEILSAAGQSAAQQQFRPRIVSESPPRSAIRRTSASRAGGIVQSGCDRPGDTRHSKPAEPIRHSKPLIAAPHEHNENAAAQPIIDACGVATHHNDHRCGYTGDFRPGAHVVHARAAGLRVGADSGASASGDGTVGHRREHGFVCRLLPAKSAARAHTLESMATASRRSPGVLRKRHTACTTPSRRWLASSFRRIPHHIARELNQTIRKLENQSL